MATELSWRDRGRELRNRLLGSPRFQRLSTRFAPTRRIARRRARRLFDLCAGFVYSQVLLACVRAHLLDALSAGPLELAAIAQRIALPRDAAETLVRAAVSVGLLERRGAERVGLGELGAILLGNPSLLAMIEHHALLYADLADPLALLRGEQKETALQRYWAYARADAPAALGGDEVAAYSALMSASQALIADQVLDAYPLARHRTLLDVGGGEGAFLTAVAARAPHLKLLLFDLPPVAARARARFAAAGLGERASAFGGSFLSDPLPPGADVVTLVRVVHDHDDANVLALLRAVRAALAPGGVLLVAEPMSGTRGAEPVADAYFAFYLKAMGSGRPRTSDEIGQLLARAGFGHVRDVATAMPLQTRLLVAQP